MECHLKQLQNVSHASILLSADPPTVSLLVHVFSVVTGNLKARKREFHSIEDNLS